MGFVFGDEPEGGWFVPVGGEVKCDHRGGEVQPGDGAVPVHRDRNERQGAGAQRVVWRPEPERLRVLHQAGADPAADSDPEQDADHY